MIELTHKRKLDSKLFDTGRTQLNADGVTEDPIYGTRVQNGLHDIEPDGSYVEVNALFEPSDDGDETDRVRRTRCGRISISNKLEQSKDRIKVLTKNGNGITLKLRGIRTYGPHFDDLKSCYYTTDEGYILRYYPYYKGVKLVIEIPNPQTSTNVFRFVVRDIGCDYTYKETPKGIKCASSTGQDDLFIINPYAVDANGEYGTVNLRLGEKTPEGYQVIRKVISPVWLGNAAGPVLADPNVTINDDSGTVLDALFSSFSTNLNYNFGINPANAVHKNASTNQANCWIKVDLSSYSGVTITDSYWGFDVYAVNGVLTVDGYKCLRDLIEGTKNGSAASTGEPTWNSYAHPTAWTTGGGRGSGTDREAIADNSLEFPSINSDLHFAVSTALTQFWINSPSSNFGELFDTEAAAIQQGPLWHSSQAVSGNKPYFYMEYTEADGGFPFFFGAGHY